MKKANIMKNNEKKFFLGTKTYSSSVTNPYSHEKFSFEKCKDN